MIRPLDAYHSVMKKAISDTPNVYPIKMTDYGNEYEFFFGKKGSEYAHENVYYLDKKTGEITKKHFMTVVLEGEKSGEEIDFTQFEKRAS